MKMRCRRMVFRGMLCWLLNACLSNRRLLNGTVTVEKLKWLRSNYCSSVIAFASIIAFVCLLLTTLELGWWVVLVRCRLLRRMLTPVWVLIRRLSSLGRTLLYNGWILRLLVKA